MPSGSKLMSFFCLYNDDNQKTRTYKLKNIQPPDSK